VTEWLLHFTLAPVQSFVAQARRTSDLWAGSFLLSWLAGQAMKVVIQNKGAILVPVVSEDALFAAISKGTGQVGPAVGSLPNRFKATAPDGFNPLLCREAVHAAWRGLADNVWLTFVEPVAGRSKGAKVIWDRQVEGFWETTWVIGPDPGGGGDHAWLDRRKNWRTHHGPIEGGDHCMLMGDRQELSGFVRSRERDAQDKFWRALKEHVDKNSRNTLQLDEGERLCAVALIKRLFPHVAKDALGWTPASDGKPLLWPSTPRLAATGWLRRAWQSARPEAEAFVKVAKGARGGLMEPALDQDNPLSRVAGALLHRSGIENARPEEFAGDSAAADATRAELLEAYTKLAKQAGEPSPFYGLLLMDGDRVGALLRRQNQEGEVAEGLARFSSQVDRTVREHDGATIYAGGDDVLALLPLEGALRAALALRMAYRRAFERMPDATISAAIVYAHFHVPLRHVLREAHRRLDDVAKDGNDRDSVALCVLSQTGVTRDWVSKWEADGVSPPRLAIETAQEIDEKTSGRFFYAMREQYEDVIKGGVLDPDDVRAVLLAEYRRSASGAGQTSRDIGALIDKFFALAKGRAAPAGSRADSAPSMDGPLIARFLAREARRE
jgi:CRISPR-associated protein Cmr2